MRNVIQWRRGVVALASLAGTWVGQTAFADEVIVGAGYVAPTEVYPHCVLGDCVEWSGLRVLSQDADGVRFARTFTLPLDAFVFEDTAPRLWDVTGDGLPEVVVVKTSLTQGAALAVYSLAGEVAQTAHIGQPNRWLAPVGAADLDGDGRIEIAFIDRPHLAKTMRIFEFSGGNLRLETEIVGLTNHRIGEDFITGGLRDCGNGPELVTADGAWGRVMITSFDDDTYQSVADATYSPVAVADALACR